MRFSRAPARGEDECDSHHGERAEAVPFGKFRETQELAGGHIALEDTIIRNRAVR